MPSPGALHAPVIALASAAVIAVSPLAPTLPDVHLCRHPPASA